MALAKMGSTVTGLRGFVYAVMTDEAAETYGPVKQFAESMSVKVSPSVSSEKLFTDNALSETADGVNNASIELGVKALTKEVEAEIYGHGYDSKKGGIIKLIDDVAPFVAFGYIECYNDGSERFIWLPKVKFEERTSSSETQGETKKLQTQETIKGTATGRKRDKVWEHDVFNTDTTLTASEYFAAPYELPTATSVISIALSESNKEITEGTTEQLTVTFTPNAATNQKVQWFSTDTSKVIVDQTGKITAVAEGTATVTAVTNDGNKTASCAVTVSA